MYTPLNTAVFQAAYAGASAGMNGNGLGSGQASIVAASYAPVQAIAFAFAQEYDTNRGSAASTSLENLATEALCEEAFRDRNPTGTGLSGPTTPLFWFGDAQAIFAAVTELVTIYNGGITPGATGANRAWITNEVTTNGQGSGGPTIVALAAVKCKGSGIFRWLASAEQAAAAATEVLTWTVTTQTGTPALTTTGGTAVAAANGSAPADGTILFASAAAGTGIAVTAGGGSEQTIESKVQTIGTAAVGGTYGGGGIVYNAGAPFAVGNNVILLLKVTNSANNRVVASMNLSLEEIG